MTTPALNEKVAELMRLVDELSARKVACGLVGVVSDVDTNAARAAVEAFARAALERPAVPDGWQLVPVEPTKAMLYEIQENAHILPPRGKRVWQMLLAAAPKETP